MTIWKFPLQAIGESTINMPKGAKILSTQLQGNVAQLWAVVDEEAKIIKHKIRVVGTGGTLPNNYNCDYIGTFQMYGGNLIFHVFDEGEI